MTAFSRHASCRDALEQSGIDSTIATGRQSTAPNIELKVNANLIAKPQGYRLRVDDDGITIVGGDEAALFYGVQTLCQLVKLCADGDILRLPILHIEDWPDFPNRGVMLDITRDRVPTMESL